MEIIQSYSYPDLLYVILGNPLQDHYEFEILKSKEFLIDRIWFSKLGRSNIEALCPQCKLRELHLYEGVIYCEHCDIVLEDVKSIYNISWKKHATDRGYRDV